jgi:MerR family transcriptional regulator/heat shock protein HspR
MKKKKGYFSISAVAQMFSIHQQTIRLYEQEGLICPKRSEGNTRLFSEEDVNKLEEIVYLTHKLGINLAGVEMILKLKKKINKLQKDLNEIFDATQDQLDEETKIIKENARDAAQRLLTIKQEALQAKLESSPREDESSPSPENIDWKVEYED